MAAMTSIMMSVLPTTTTATNSIPQFISSSSLSSSTFNYLTPVSKTSKLIKHINQFPPKSSSTDRNSVITPSSGVSNSLDSACDVVRRFYNGINSRNLSIVVDLIADDCVYEDLVFPQPFVGRKAILEFFEKFIYTISQDLQFVIDDISGEDTSAVGVTWHLEWKGKPFPFSKGCSFYRLEVLDGQRKIIYARDIVEPAVKPGDFALGAIRGVTWLLEQFPQLAERF